MGFKTVRTSDLTGEELDDDKVVTVVVRGAGKVLDATREELVGLKPLNNVVEVELRNPDGSSEEIIVSKADFDKVITADVLDKADSIRGRRTGFRPTNGNGG